MPWSPTKHEARRAKNAIRRRLRSAYGGEPPPWIRGIGITYQRRPDSSEAILQPDGRLAYAVQVGVQKPKHLALVRQLLGGDVVLGVPIVYEVIGDIYAFSTGAESFDDDTVEIARDEMVERLGLPWCPLWWLNGIVIVEGPDSVMGLKVYLTPTPEAVYGLSQVLDEPWPAPPSMLGVPVRIEEGFPLYAVADAA